MGGGVVAPVGFSSTTKSILALLMWVMDASRLHGCEASSLCSSRPSSRKQENLIMTTGSCSCRRNKGRRGKRMDAKSGKKRISKSRQSEASACSSPSGLQRKTETLSQKKMLYISGNLLFIFC